MCKLPPWAPEAESNGRGGLWEIFLKHCLTKGQERQYTWLSSLTIDFHPFLFRGINCLEFWLIPCTSQVHSHRHRSLLERHERHQHPQELSTGGPLPREYGPLSIGNFVLDESTDLAKGYMLELFSTGWYFRIWLYLYCPPCSCIFPICWSQTLQCSLNSQEQWTHSRHLLLHNW